MHAIEASCFHCGEPLGTSTLSIRMNGEDRAVCCIGCRAATEWIASAGLNDFYRFRSAPTGRPDEESALKTDRWSAYEQPELANRFIRRNRDLDAVHLVIDGLRCSACSWLLDRSLRRVPGVRNVQVNAATSRTYIEWETSPKTLPEILRLLATLGFTPHPVGDDVVARLQESERRSSLKRLAVAAFGMMQVMMFAVAGYSADLNHETIDASLQEYFRLISLLIATPVVGYSGWPFFKNALRSLQLKTLGVDVPVSVALLIAFVASVWNSLRGAGEVYFDSVTMFVFFLTAGRFVEMSLRHRTNDLADALARHLPAIAHRVSVETMQDVATDSLVDGDIVVVRAGEIAPADGVIVSGSTHIDESLLTGESIARQRDIGDPVIGGALNLRAPISVRVTATGDRTVIATIGMLMQRAQAQKPSGSRITEAAASRFVHYVLFGAIAVCLSWLAVDPARAFEATLAVLVVACPCAFSIATPATFTAAAAQLSRLGLLVVRIDAIEGLAKIKRCVFDKTGTLTEGKMRIQHAAFHTDAPRREVLAIAAALEQSSEHPIARAFVEHDGGKQVESAEIIPGRGIEGVIDGRRYRIGALSFVFELCQNTLRFDAAASASQTTVALGDEREMLATFTLSDSLRDGGADIAARLARLGVASEILSGDSADAVSAVARQCNIKIFAARRLPGEKLAHIRGLMERNESVLVVGDGINDAPVLGVASVSMAMGRGAALAHASADLVLVNEQLQVLPEAIAVARRAIVIVKQNLFWAAAYNLSALPLAALGLVPPWIAAIGMSLSSIAVIANAMRLVPRRAATSKTATLDKSHRVPRQPGPLQAGGSTP